MHFAYKCGYKDISYARAKDARGERTPLSFVDHLPARVGVGCKRAYEADFGVSGVDGRSRW